MSFTFSPQKTNLTDAFVRIIYNDGKIIEPLSQHYTDLTRKDLKSATIVSKDGKTLFTLPIINDTFIYRKKVTGRGLQGGIGGSDSKRGVMLATEGRISYFWDSEEIKEFTEWQDYEPYTKPELISGEVFTDVKTD